MANETPDTKATPAAKAAKPPAKTPDTRVVPATKAADAAAAAPVKTAESKAHAETKAGALSPAEMAELKAPVTRREFLNYAFLATLGLFFVELGAATYFFALPRFKVGEFGGIFPLGTAGEAIPPVTDPPKPDQKAKVWLSHTDQGVLALYNVCVHLGCLYQWQPVSNRFECPCHGSKYQKNGTYIEGPAPRSLDRMVITFLDQNGKELARTNAAGDPLPIPDPNAQLVIDTGKIIQGKTHG